MPPPHSHGICDKMAAAPSREREDELDWLENQRRSAEDVRRVDGRFLAGAALGTFVWAALGAGTIGGIVAVGTWLLAPLFGGH
jgi:hypothetical protein